jgi:uncharacterized phiE125 gp8 family phage protein
MSLSLVTAPENEPLALEDVKAHVQQSQSFDDTYLSTLIEVARQRCEGSTRRALITQTWDLFLDQWPLWDGYHGGRTFEGAGSLLPAGGFVWLPKAPLQSITFIKYTDLTGAVQTWDPVNYLVDAPSGDRCARGRLSLGWVKIWPIVRPTANSIQIRMVTGYGDNPEDVPALLRQGMLLDIGTLYGTRSSVLSGNRAASIEIASTTSAIYKQFRSL